MATDFDYLFRLDPSLKPKHYIPSKEIVSAVIKCDHKDITYDKGEKICCGCGQVIEEVNYDKDWRWYDNSSTNPARCHKQKTTTRTLSDIMQKTRFPKSIAEEIEVRYQKILEKLDKKNGKKMIVRGDNRKAIAGAIAFNVFIDEGEPRTWNELSVIFDLEIKKLYEGQDRYTEAYPERKGIYLKPVNLVKRIMRKIGIENQESLDAVVRLCGELENTSSIMKNSYPNSIASSIVYMWCKKHKKIDMTRVEFAKKVDLSDNTIEKIVKDAEATLEKLHTRW